MQPHHEIINREEASNAKIITVSCLEIQPWWVTMSILAFNSSLCVWAIILWFWNHIHIFTILEEESVLLFTSINVTIWAIAVLNKKLLWPQCTTLMRAGHKSYPRENVLKLRPTSNPSWWSTFFFRKSGKVSTLLSVLQNLEITFDKGIWLQCK